MSTFVTPNQVKYLLIGSSIYSTGGGLEISVQKKLFAGLFRQGRELRLVSIDELPSDAYVSTAYAVGSAGDTDVNLSYHLQLALQTLERKTKKKFAAIFAGETNIDALIFQAASSIGLPALDADATGGRAVPEIVIDNFVVAGKQMTPTVAVTLEGEVQILKHEPDAQKIEAFVRAMASKSKAGVVAVVDHAVAVREAKELLTLGIFKRAIELGQYIDAHRKRKNILELLAQKIGGKILIRGTVNEVALVDDRNEGFLLGHYVVRDANGGRLKIFVKNENIMAWFANGRSRVAVAPPDFIMTVDTTTLVGVHNSKIRVGQPVAVLTKVAGPLWNSQKGRVIFSPKHFGLF